MRDGNLQKIPSRTVVPGDVIKLDEGDVVPADCRLVEEDKDMQVDQSTITGESMAVTKRGSEKDIIYSSKLKSTIKFDMHLR